MKEKTHILTKEQEPGFWKEFEFNIVVAAYTGTHWHYVRFRKLDRIFMQLKI